MKRILEYHLYQHSDRSILLMEEFKPVGNPKWPTNWKDMDLWKDLEEMGFSDVTTPIQAKNGTIMIVNQDFPHMYPAGVVLQSSGYIRDKAARSGFIKQYKTQFTLDDVFDYIKDRWSKEYKRMNPENKGTLTPEDIRLINAATKSPWRWNSSTNSVDVDGNVDLNSAASNKLGGFKFGVIKGEFKMQLDQVIDSIEDFGPSKAKAISIYTSRENENSGIKSTKGFPQNIKEATIWSKSLVSLEDLPLDMESLKTLYFMISPFNIENCFKVLEFGKVNTYYSPGGGSIVKRDDDSSPEDDDKARALISTVLDDASLDLYFKKNPLKLHLLDEHPDIKAGVLRRTGMKDISKIGKNLDTGWI